MIRLSRQKAR